MSTPRRARIDRALYRLAVGYLLALVVLVAAGIVPLW